MNGVAANLSSTSIIQLNLTAEGHQDIFSILSLLSRSRMPALRTLSLHLVSYVDGCELCIDTQGEEEEEEGDPHALDASLALTETELREKFPLLASVHVILGLGFQEVNPDAGEKSNYTKTLRASQFLRLIDDMKLLTVAYCPYRP
jgi:hypothetical protein